MLLRENVFIHSFIFFFGGTQGEGGGRKVELEGGRERGGGAGGERET